MQSGQRTHNDGLRMKTVKAFAYLRTSSATNTGADKDSGKRQREAIAAFAERAGYMLAGEFYDEAVSGADAIDLRPGFAAMLTAIAGNGVRVIIVETANRFARDLIVQEVGFRQLRDAGIELIAAIAPTALLRTPRPRLCFDRYSGPSHSLRKRRWLPS